jgi:hypothetical protein
LAEKTKKGGIFGSKGVEFAAIDYLSFNRSDLQTIDFA